MKQFLSVNDVADPMELVQKALACKKSPFDDPCGVHKTLGLLFFSPSLRTRMSSQVAAQNLGMNVITMNVQNEGWPLELNENVIMDGAESEHIKEAAKVLSQYCDIIGIRSFAEMGSYEADATDQLIKQFAKYSLNPVVSLESTLLHPLQSLSDLMTIESHKKVRRPKVVMTWAPHPKALPQAVANSFAQWMNRCNVDFTITNPPGLDLPSQFTQKAAVIHDQDEALEEADFVYAKSWSAGSTYGKPMKGFESWMITSKKMDLTNKAYFMHCLPVRRNVVVQDEVLDSPSSLILEQANNRTFAAQAVLKSLI